jgi:hypothetical protein
MRYEGLMALAIFFASFFLAPAALAQQKTSQPQQWEYKIVKTCDPKDRGVDIQQLGEEGWELVISDLVGENDCATRYFKRPKGLAYKQVVKAPPQPPTAPQCALPLDKAPVIRGLRLGMTAEDILQFFSTNSSKAKAQDALKNAGAAPNYGLASFYLLPSPNDSKEVQEKFSGISYLNFKALDGLVVEISVSYRFDNASSWWTQDEWIAKLSNAFDLPGPNNWVWSNATNQRMLKCKEFEVGANVQNILNMTVTDPTHRQVMEQRAKSDREKKHLEFAP